MSATVQTTQAVSYRTRAGKPLTPGAASLLGAMLAALVVAGLFAISSTSAGTKGCIPRVGCESAIESGAGAAAASFPSPSLSERVIGSAHAWAFFSVASFLTST